MSDPEDLLRRLGTAGVPVLPAEAAAARRERMVGAIGRSIRAAQSRRERAAIVGRGAAVTLLAASVALGVWGATRDVREPAPAPAAHARSGLVLRSVSGKIALSSKDGQGVAPAPGAVLDGGGVIKTDQLARAELGTDKSRLVLHERGELAVTSASATEERIELRSGRVDVAVEKHVHPERSVIVETPHAEIRVRGTRFEVQVAPRDGSPDPITDVGVTQGQVVVLQRGAVVAWLGAGDRWSSQPARDVVKPSAVPEAAASSRGPRPARPSASSAEPAGTLAEENRLFQEALEARGRGEHARAVELFGRLLARYPGSPLTEEARAERFRGLRRLGQTARAAAEARRYLAHHPNGFAAAEARQLALEPVRPGRAD